MKYSVLFLFLTLFVHSQKRVTNSDVANFWNAYDKVQQTKDSVKQIEIINSEYLQKASPALKALITMDKMSASDYIKSIQRIPKRWNKVRSTTLQIVQQNYEIDKLYRSFKEIYPSFHSPQIGFVIGTFNRGGTTTREFILIGTEVAALTPFSDTELKQSTEYNIAHELVHVQQDYVNGVNNEEEYHNLDLLGWALMEGSCDFVAEKLLGKLPYIAYIEYGGQHEKELWYDFKKDMYLYDTDKWMYNGSTTKDKPADLAYFVGYAICKSYYEQAVDKKEALNEIININYSKNEHHAFFKKAGYMK
ncbi:gliding motility protein GldB-related protein [Chryseobacterium jejuense]|uniref:Predicted Zn-dependent protease n=1 Tax=Chryseobacterium jejuense TaxID=445960 RepID=A0A2X2X0P6_CHRJE|nr:DUF2268 domain-containing putative Zn-dependent protease [Chryseobacterium jejuense]SDI16897.1 Predicted Zn-dependent protease [Chryseobacterium jejuense]SQB46566.1 Predicted Zn-dependent protease (DUF2268) [Chryseobacterium jejuense]